MRCTVPCTRYTIMRPTLRIFTTWVACLKRCRLQVGRISSLRLRLPDFHLQQALCRRERSFRVCWHTVICKQVSLRHYLGSALVSRCLPHCICGGRYSLCSLGYLQSPIFTRKYKNHLE